MGSQVGIPVNATRFDTTKTLSRLSVRQFSGISSRYFKQLGILHLARLRPFWRLSKTIKTDTYGWSISGEVQTGAIASID
jgi:hypothetical protein